MQFTSILSRLTFIKTRLTRRRLLSASMAFLIGSSVLVPLVQVPVRAQLAAPTPLTPTNGLTTTSDNYPPLGIPELTWTAVAGATNYRIEISNNVGFTTLAYNANTPHTSHTPPNVGNLSDGTWYWRVRVESPSPPGDYSMTMSFTKQWASPGNLPTLTSPADSATLDFFDKPNFSWEPVMGAADYRFQIATSYDGFNAPVYNQTTLAFTHQPATKLANGDYYWRVVPRDPSSNDGTPSAVRTFTVSYNDPPTLLEPANNSFPTFTPTFRWTAMRGAQYYRLQYTTDPTFDTGVTQVDTRNTTYTPLNALPNDVNYYWRVRTHSGNSITDWSSSWTFLKQWYTQTVLLTPVNLYQYTNPPLFNWTPVPGAGRYKVELSTVNSFPPSGGWSETTANVFHIRPNFNPDLPDPDDDLWYWRVTPIDGSGNEGRPSAVDSFVGQWFAVSPQLIYPFYYYSSEEAGLEHLELMQPREDRTVAVPIFMWHRVFTPTSAMTQPVAAYRIEVDDTYNFSSPAWTFETENLSAVPTADDPFTPDANTSYYWRVRPLDGLGGAEIGQWSQKWKTRIDTSTGLSATVGSAPTLLRPPHASELVEITPLLEWWPLQGADSYEVQISTDGEFGPSYIVDTATVPYPAYTPSTRQTYYGTYYWRVRGISGGSPGAWSTSWRFQIAAQSHWKASRTVGYNQSLIGSDPAGEMSDSNYDVTTLHATQDADAWFFGLDADTDTTNMVYVLYLDLDHEDGSGATSDAQGYNVNTISAHRPEYAIYIAQNSGSFAADTTEIYSWNGSAWAAESYLLSEISGALYYTSTTNYLEIEVPNTVIGMEEETGSAAVSLFSVMSSGGHAQDTVPSDPNVAYTVPNSGGETTTLSRFASISERVTLAMPPTNATSDPTVFPSVQPFSWRLPVDASWNGYNLEVSLDEEFTSWIRQATVIGPSPGHYVDQDKKDLNGDNTYYWRVRPVYGNPNPMGAWSEPGRFERLGFVAQNLQTSVSFATPTFSWDMPEGADSYDIEVDDDPGFGSPAISKNTKQPSYTPENTLAKGTYYWRVRVKRYGGIINDWTYTQTFTLNLPQPTGLSHDPPGVADRAPTLCWTPLITPSSGIPLLAAYKYRVEVSRGDPTFSSLYDNVETEQSCWTPQKGYDDGTYYWHVAMRDGQNRLGDYSEAITFTKQYPVTTLISPTTGSQLAGTPTFVWTPVDGASSYRLEVSQYQNFGVLYDSVTTDNTRYTPKKEYEEAAYYWRVAIIDESNKYGPFNTAEIILNPYPYSIFLPTVIRNS